MEKGSKLHPEVCLSGIHCDDHINPENGAKPSKVQVAMFHEVHCTPENATPLPKLT